MSGNGAGTSASAPEAVATSASANITAASWQRAEFCLIPVSVLQNTAEIKFFSFWSKIKLVIIEFSAFQC